MVLPPAGGTRSQLGPQVNSRRASAPNYGFGSSTREHRAKVFVSQEHAALAGDSCSPGPHAPYKIVPAVGPQVNGAIASAPLFSFGASTREVANLVFISQEHAELQAAPYSPGPVYEYRPSIGPQVKGGVETAPIYGFGSGTREHREKVYISQEHNKQADYGRGSPGPHAPYQLKSSMGGQLLTAGPSPYAAGGGKGVRNATQPSWAMTKADRFGKDASAWVPGAKYDILPAVGPQVSGALVSAPKYSISKCNRDQVAKVFITREHSEITNSTDTPGPAGYKIKSLTGNPIVAGHQRTGARWGFGSGKRFTDELKHQQGNPGPGNYIV